MKRDSFLLSALWGRLGGAILLMAAFFLKPKGYDIGEEERAAINEIITALIALGGSGMIVASKIREKRKFKIEESEDAG